MHEMIGHLPIKMVATVKLADHHRWGVLSRFNIAQRSTSCLSVTLIALVMDHAGSSIFCDDSGSKWRQSSDLSPAGSAVSNTPTSLFVRASCFFHIHDAITIAMQGLEPV